MSRKTFATSIGALLVAAGLAVVPSTAPAQAGPAATAQSAFRAAPVDWTRCKDRDLRQAKAQCGYLVVPLNYANPTGPTIQLAVSRILHTKGPYRGAAFANPGGPGVSALQYSRLGGAVPKGVGKTYDWYGMDPRGVGASIPALTCDSKYSNSQHRPYKPTTPTILSYWLAKTESYAAACGTSAAKDLLPHLKTTDNVADFESLRTAIGQAQVTTTPTSTRTTPSRRSTRSSSGGSASTTASTTSAAPASWSTSGSPGCASSCRRSPRTARWARPRSTTC
jgi:hypothetical protein